MSESVVQIRPAIRKDAEALRSLGIKTFLEAHAHSASEADVNSYVSRSFSSEGISKELSDKDNHFRLMLKDERAIGYSKIRCNVSSDFIDYGAVAKLERIYILKEYYGSGLGARLLDHNISLAKENDQKGMWLHTWTENHRAIAFYKKIGFKIIGSFDFVISPTHTNPNHEMYLKF